MKQKLSRFINVYFIQNEMIEFENIIILGNTLWFRSDRLYMIQILNY